MKKKKKKMLRPFLYMNLVGAPGALFFSPPYKFKELDSVAKVCECFFKIFQSVNKREQEV